MACILSSVRCRGGGVLGVADQEPTYQGRVTSFSLGAARPPNKRMQLTKLRAAPERQDEVPPCAPAGETDGGTASQLIRGVRRTGEGGMQRSTKACPIILLALSCGFACRMPPADGVSGTVTDVLGKPITGAELTLTSNAHVFVFGIPLPFGKPMRVPTTTDALGHFGVFWSHGGGDEGPLLELSVQGYAPVAERLPLGRVECRVVLTTANSTDTRSKATCRTAGRRE